MTGGIMSLLATGSQDVYLTIAPQMSYFKQVYQRPTNFGMQSIRLAFNTAPILSYNTGQFTCQLGRYGDLIKDIALQLTLPAIYSDDNYRFRWTTNMQNYMLVQYTVNIDTYTIDSRYGEWLDIWNELSLPTDKKTAFNNLVGNTQEYMNPTNLSPIVIIKNNKIAFSYYPASTGPNNPSLAAKDIFIPLDFWFCKNPALALPIIALQYQNITVNITLESIENLYQVYDHNADIYVSPKTYNSLNGTSINIGTFTQYGGNGLTTVQLNAYLDVNYIFLDTPERTYLAQTSTIQILVEQVVRNNLAGGVTTNYTYPLILQNPIKEFIWVLRRQDALYYNDWANYTASQPANSTQKIINQAKFIWNGLDRIEFKSGDYYNILQPYTYHTSSPRQGIYAYTFALYPEKVQPSGSFNSTMVNTIQLQLTTNNFTPSTNNVITNLASSDKSYSITVYAISYNVFKIVGGRGQMAFNM
jgi:hypothetical protein